MPSSSTFLARAALAIGATAALALGAGSASAAVIGASTVSSPQGDFGGSYPLLNIINQSGLSAGYVSGVTDFASYTATTTGVGLAGAGFTGTESNGPQQFTFDLGSSTLIDAIAIWQSGSVGSVATFELYADDDGDFSNGVGALLLGSTALASQVTNAQVFNFAAVSTRFVHLNGLSSLQPPDYYGLNEVIFNGANSVPEPGSIVLLGLGLAGLGASRRRAA